MTEDEFQQKQSSGEIKIEDSSKQPSQSAEQPSAPSHSSLPENDDIENLLRTVKQNLSADPSVSPQNFIEQIQFVNNALRFWSGGAWRGVGGLSVKVGSLTRTAGSTGSQAITGFGFTPKLVIFAGTVSAGGPHFVFAVTDGTTKATMQWDTVAGQFYVSTNIFEYRVSGGNSISANLTSLDADGMTINWSAVSNTWAWFYLAVG